MVDLSVEISSIHAYMVYFFFFASNSLLKGLQVTRNFLFGIVSITVKNSNFFLSMGFDLYN